MPAPRRVPSLAEIQGKLQDKLPADKQPTAHAAAGTETTVPTEHIGRLSLPRRPSLGLIRSQSAAAVPTVPPIQSSPPPPPPVEKPSRTAAAASETAQPPAPKKEKEEHQLKHQWTLYADSKHDSGGPKPKADTYALNRIDSFKSVEGFARLFNHLKRPSRLPDKANVAMFKDNIEPTWEAPGNEGGGTWTLFLGVDQSVDLIFSEAALALIGSQLPDEELCGLVVNRRNRGDRVQFWMCSTEQSTVDTIAQAFTTKLAVHSPGLKYRTEFRAHEQAAKKASGPPSQRPQRPARMPLQRSGSTPTLGSLPVNPSLPASPAKGLGFAAFAHALPDVNGPLSPMGAGGVGGGGLSRSQSSYRPPLSPSNVGRNLNNTNNFQHTPTSHLRKSALKS